MSKPVAKPVSSKKPTGSVVDVSGYVTMLQAQVNNEIQAVKAGAVDEELLRAKLVSEMNPSSLNTEFVLWLHALAGGLIDNLSVQVSAGESGPKMEFFPEWDQKTNAMAPILELPIPGPHQVRRGGDETPALPDADENPMALAAQQS